MRFWIYLLGTVAIIASFTVTGCKKSVSFSGGNLAFSADTIYFDTVFTTIGSTTKKLKIYNQDSKTLKVEQIQLMGGASSPYRINVDGVPGTMFADIEIEAGDSLFIFVEVTLDPNNGTTPMIVEDQIRFQTNGNDQFVHLVAWGQDAYFHYSNFSTGDLDMNAGTWPNDKPHVIYNAAFVDSATTLIIQAGTDIYLHKNAILWNYKGTLNIQGQLGNEVTLQGDRLESYYDDVAGQYYGIYMQEALPSTINYAIIKNGTSGIHMYSEDAANTGYTLNLTNTIIQNCASYGVFIYDGAKVQAENCVIARNGIHSLLVLQGGDFNFNHCTVVGYGTGDNTGAAVGISNYYTDPYTQTTTVGPINEGTMTNCVLYGNIDQELAIDTLSGSTLNFMFNRNVIRSAQTFTESFFTNTIWNQDPLFMDVTTGDFHFWGGSPLDNNGMPPTPATDIEGTMRTGPDIGAYEN